MAVIGGLLAACAPPPSPRLPTTAAATGQRGSPPIAGDSPTVVSTRSPDPDASSVGDPGTAHADDAAELASAAVEQTELAGPGGIRVSVRRRTNTGTWHIAEELVIRTPGGMLRFTEPATDVAVDDVAVQYPLMEEILEVGPNRWVLLGWSSLGEGLQTEHAWLVEARRGPQLLDTLTWTTDRSHAGLAVASSGNQVRIGIPLPQPLDDDGGPGLHNKSGWELVHGKQRLDLEEVERLPSSQEHVMALRGYYDPPFQVEPSRRRWAGRFIWFSSGTRFTIEHRLDQ